MTGESPKIGSDEYAWAGLASATKPASAFIGQKAKETDTGNTFEWTGLSWQQTTIGGAQNVGGVFDFAADIEIDGLPLTPLVGDKATSGDTTILAVGAGDRVKVYGISISADATLTGDVYLKIGSTQSTIKVRNAIVGGVHWVFPISSNYLLGALGEDLALNNSVAEDISYAVYYEVYTP